MFMTPHVDLIEIYIPNINNYMHFMQSIYHLHMRLSIFNWYILICVIYTRHNISVNNFYIMLLAWPINRLISVAKKDSDFN